MERPKSTATSVPFEEDTLKCFFRNETCGGSSDKPCQIAYETCKDQSMSTHCYSIMLRTAESGYIDSLKRTFTSSNDQDIKNASTNQHFVSKLKDTSNILLAGCWTGNDECSPPSYIQGNFNFQIFKH
jgi:hypothetical protein